MTIASTFDTSTEGWTVHLGGTGPIWVPDGAGGGYITSSDSSLDSDYYFLAPSAFLGNLGGYYGGILSFDLQQGGGPQFDGAYDVILIGASGL
jgi:hypothetical protein